MLSIEFSSWMKTLTDLCESFTDEDTEVETRIKQQGEIVIQIESRSSEVDSLIYKWKKEQHNSYKSDEIRYAVEELETDWIELGGLANEKLDTFKRILETGVRI